MILRILHLENLTRSAGLMLIAIGLFFLTFAYVFTRAGILQASLSPNGVDFVRGLCCGVGFVLEVAGISAIVAARNRSKE